MRALREMLLSYRVANAEAKLLDAVKQHVRCQAEMKYHASLAFYHSERAQAINPLTHWNEYAEAKNAWQSEWNDTQLARRVRDTANEKRRIRQQQLDKLREGAA